MLDQRENDVKKQVGRYVELGLREKENGDGVAKHGVQPVDEKQTRGARKVKNMQVSSFLTKKYVKFLISRLCDTKRLICYT